MVFTPDYGPKVTDPVDRRMSEDESSGRGFSSWASVGSNGGHRGRVSLFPKDRQEKTDLRRQDAAEVKRLHALLAAWTATLPQNPDQACLSSRR